jgi:periplasmic protein TonB
VCEQWEGRIVMMATNDNRFSIPAWGVSLALHGTVVGLAFAFAAQVKPILQEDLFQWDVALVETAKSAPLPEPVESVMTPVQAMAKVVPPSRPKRVAEVSPVVSPPEQPIEPAPSIEQHVEAPQVREEPVEQRVVEVAESKTEPVAVAASPDPVEAQPIQQEPVAMASAPVLSSDVSVSQERTVSAVATLDSEAKTDNRWLAESLWRRVAELKRYPSLARLNGQEGKVILKAVIRSDGQLADVFVQKSSGYSTLDEAAIEAVKLACPLHMKHAIGKPQIVVSLPIVYSLAN